MKMFLKFTIYISLISSIFCWPNLLFFSRNNPNDYIQLTPENIAKSGFNFTKLTKFVIHGFNGNGLDGKIVDIKNRLLKRGDFNVILVDWKEGAKGPNYFLAADNVEINGRKVGEFIQDSNIDVSKVHCIGHSLGAHSCGFVGKFRRIKRISGLDPAGPLFFGRKNSRRLDKTDAELVDNIHTDVLLGINIPIGHQDFFPNNGRRQPGCGIFDDTDEAKETITMILSPGSIEIQPLSCSHNRAPAYFAESITSDCKFHSVPCDDYDGFSKGTCKCDPKTGCAPMGFYSDDIFAPGTYYLDTNKSEPYCIS